MRYRFKPLLKINDKKCQITSNTQRFERNEKLIIIFFAHGVVVRFDSKFLVSISFPLFAIIVSQRNDLLLKSQRLKRP